MATVPEAARALLEVQAKHPFFVGIDSDGCIFDTMEIKHKECFIPNIIRCWGLQAVSKYAREAGEFVNLYSKWRGINRWPALVMVFDLLGERPEVQKRGAAIPKAAKIREFIASGRPLSNDSLKAIVAETGDPEMAKALDWSLAVNRSIEETVFGVPPFPYVREGLQMMAEHAEMVVVSQTPTEALVREWEEHDIARYVQAIAGQEMGTKSEHLKYASGGKYAPGRVLMIGDALGDLKAARDNKALFFPVNPGREDESWERFYTEAFGKFIRGEYAGAYESGLIAEFQALLPEVPPWKR